jgi:hypothetical protein
MARRFNGSTDYINCGSAASLDNIGGSPGSRSACAWYYQRGYGELGARIFQKSDAGSSGWYLSPASDVGVAGRPYANLGGGTQGQAVAVTTTDYFRWWFVGMSYTPSDGGPRLFIGNLTTAVYEPAYVKRQDVVTYGSDASANFIIGNNDTGAAFTFDGDIAMVAVADNLMVRDQFEIIRQSWQTRRQLFPLDLLTAFRTAGGTQINFKGLWLMDT